jgi:hypothetical protein
MVKDKKVWYAIDNDKTPIIKIGAEFATPGVLPFTDEELELERKRVNVRKQMMREINFSKLKKFYEFHIAVPLEQWENEIKKHGVVMMNWSYKDVIDSREYVGYCQNPPTGSHSAGGLSILFKSTIALYPYFF